MALMVQNPIFKFGDPVTSTSARLGQFPIRDRGASGMESRSSRPLLNRSTLQSQIHMPLSASTADV